MNKLLLCAIGFVLCCSLSACKTDVAADINLDEDVVTQSNFSGAEAKTESVLPENEPETQPPQDMIQETQKPDAIVSPSEVPSKQNGDMHQGPLEPENTGDNRYVNPVESQIPDGGRPIPDSSGVSIEISGLVPEDGLNSQAGVGSTLTTVNSAELRSFFEGLDYHSYTCDGLPEYIVLFDDGAIYYVNLTSRWVWQGKDKEATLSENLLSELQELLSGKQTE